MEDEINKDNIPTVLPIPRPSDVPKEEISDLEAIKRLKKFNKKRGIKSKQWTEEMGKFLMPRGFFIGKKK